MQKARRHPTKGLRPLVSTRFQVLFTPLFAVLFTFPSRYWFTIGLSGVCSLSGWCRWIQRGFLRSPPTQESATVPHHFAYRTLTVYGRLSHAVRLNKEFLTGLRVGRPGNGSPATPHGQRLPAITPKRFRLLRVRSPLLTGSFLLSSRPAT